MPGKTTYLTNKDFIEKGTIALSGFECTINNSFFRKSDSLSNRQIKEVLNICKKYHSFDINTLIVREEEILTIWIEEKSKITQSAENHLQQPQAEIPANNLSLPTKTVTRRYRGQVYEETVIDWSAVQQSNRHNKSSYKYRGQYINPSS